MRNRFLLATLLSFAVTISGSAQLAITYTLLEQWVLEERPPADLV